MRQRSRRLGRPVMPLLMSVGLAVLVVLGSAVLPPSRPAQALEQKLGSNVTVGAGAHSVAVDSNSTAVKGNRAYVTNGNVGTISVLDGRANAVMGAIDLGGATTNPRGIAVDPVNRRIYVAQSGDHTVRVINPDNPGTSGFGEIIDTISLTSGLSPGLQAGLSLYGVAVDPVTRTIYVANFGSDTVSVIDGFTHQVVATPLVGHQPRGIAYNPSNGQVYVANSGTATAHGISPNTVTRIQASNNAVLGSIGVGTAPYGVAVNPSTNRVYVANFTSSTVSVIDGSNNTVVGSPITVGTNPTAVAVNPTGNRVYVTNASSNSVTVIDGRTSAVDGSAIALGASTGPFGVGINPNSGFVYTANTNNGTVSVLGVPHLTESIVGSADAGNFEFSVAVNPLTNRVYVADVTSGTLATLDGATLQPVAGRPLTIGGGPVQVAVDPTTNRVYVTQQGASAVAVIDGATNALLGAIPVGTAAGTGPIGLAVDPDRHLVYVANNNGGSVAVIEGGSGSNPGTLKTTISAGMVPTARSVAVNSSTRRAYVVGNGPTTVSVIDGATEMVTGSPINVGASTLTVAINATTGHLYVSNGPIGALDAVSVFDVNGDANTLIATVAVGRPQGMDVNSKTNRIYVASPAAGFNTLTVIDGATNTIVGAPLAFGSVPASVAVNPNTSRTYVATPAGAGLLAIGPSYSSSTSAVLPGNTIQVTWSGMFGTNGGDFVGLYGVSAGTPALAAVRFTNGNTVASGNGVPQGTINLPLPSANVPPGVYDLRLVSGHTGFPTLASLRFRVQANPTATNESYTVAAGSTLTVPVGSGLLANDSDPDNPETLTAQVVSQPSSGTLNLQGNGSFTYTPAANVNGPVTFTYQAVDGDNFQSSVATATITITGQRPAAVNDSYAVTGGIDLSVSAADGLLKNDTDADTPGSGLTVAALSQPTGGILTLQPSGAFIYHANQGFSGADSFTYRVTDSQGLTSDVATVSFTVSAVTSPPVVNPTTCGPRPTVAVQTQVVGGALQATVTASNTNAPNNTLSQIQFGTLQNAQVTLNDQPVASGQAVALPAGTTTQTFTVRRGTTGGATTVPLTVTDACGSWPTFVGGGAGAGF